MSSVPRGQRFSCCAWSERGNPTPRTSRQTIIFITELRGWTGQRALCTYEGFGRAIYPRNNRRSKAAGKPNTFLIWLGDGRRKAACAAVESLNHRAVCDGKDVRRRTKQEIILRRDHNSNSTQLVDCGFAHEFSARKDAGGMFQVL